MDRRDNRIMAVRDGRNPYGSRGGYVSSSRTRRGRRGDRGMDYAEQDMRRGRDRGRMDMGDYANDMRGRGDYAQDMDYDMRRGDYEGGMDGHYGRQSAYEPVEFMGYCNGYYGSPEDYGRGRGRDYARYDMRGGRGGRGRDYGDYDDYGDDYGDFGETLSEEELDKWCKKLKEQLDEREKQMFSKDSIMQKAKALGKKMEGFGEKELEVATLMVYTDYKQTIGQNPDLAIRLAYDWLTDKDVAVKGAEKLAVYYDCIVEGE